ncbi:uncharacterized protein TNCV_3442341 [Trichonephila clavipes]|nr:uncharacterized protein TNCV_3442341 [Trichonephila clavipes]
MASEVPVDRWEGVDGERWEGVAIRQPSISHTCSIRFKSGEYAGHSIRVISSDCRHSSTMFARYRRFFKYLGTIINDQNKLKAEINNRIKPANKCFFGLKKQLRSKFISGKTKLRLYKTLILPVLLYASETWTLNLETVRALETFERKALRTIFGPVKDQGCWRTRYNFELYRLYKEPQVTQVIRSNRLRWLGHICRSPENNQTRAYTFKNPMGSRTRGRPQTRWIDDVENGLKTLNIKNWQRVAAYRWNWRKRAVEAAKTCNRLLRL